MRTNENTSPAMSAAYVVLQEISPGHWRLLAEVPRRPGMTARAARARAVQDAIGRAPAARETYVAVLRSEWAIAAEW